MRYLIHLSIFFLVFTFSLTVPAEPLPGTDDLITEGDLAMQMVADIDAYLMQETERIKDARGGYWKRDTSSPEAYNRSIQPNRDELKRILGIVDERDEPKMEWVSEVNLDHRGQSITHKQNSAAVAGQNPKFYAYNVRWSVFRGVTGEGLLLVPKGKITASVITLPDCDDSPESIAGLVSEKPPQAQFARRLAENGCMVIVPTLINRKDDYSGVPEFRMTNQPHREYLWRAAYEMGRTIVGYEVQKVLAVVDWIKSQETGNPIGVVGYGEGGLLAFYAAACDPRINAACVSGYFQPRENLWNEPIYRNAWSLLTQFGDAEITSLIAPRPLVIEASRHPQISGPPQTPNRSGGAPGITTTPDFNDVENETIRATNLVPTFEYLTLIQNQGSEPVTDEATWTFLSKLNQAERLIRLSSNPIVQFPVDIAARHKRQFEQILEDTQYLMRESEFTRADFWKKADASSADSWVESTKWYKDYFWENIIGKLPEPKINTPARTRQIYDTPAFTGYEVVLDVYDGLFAYGILLLPKNLQPNERRPVIVCQHGLEGRPQDVADPAKDHPAYHQYACKLAERGYVVFAPQNPYIGEDKFRVLLRKAQPLQLTLFSFIVRQHEWIIEWLAQQPFSDPNRIAFYGLSYGGKTAMRVPALIDGYCLSICSADYNEWIWKNVSSRHRYSYLLTGEYDMPEFNLGNTFNYAEMSWFIFPRPFMVERGHHDGVAPDEWVAYEYARTRRHYNLMGFGSHTEIEFFNGPHTINGIGTFAFLDRQLNFEQK